MTFAVAQGKENPNTKVVCMTREARRLSIKCLQSGKWKAEHVFDMAKVPADGKAA